MQLFRMHRRLLRTRWRRSISMTLPQTRAYSAGQRFCSPLQERELRYRRREAAADGALTVRGHGEGTAMEQSHRRPPHWKKLARLLSDPRAGRSCRGVGEGRAAAGLRTARRVGPFGGHDLQTHGRPGATRAWWSRATAALPTRPRLPPRPRRDDARPRPLPPHARTAAVKTNPATVKSSVATLRRSS